MNVSLNWLKQYLDIDYSVEEISEILTAIGLEVEGVNHVKSGPDLQGVKVGHVLTKGQHPNADKLSVTTVDVGGAEPLHIVCGAPNVDAGQKVLVATIGTSLPTEGDKPFVIKKGKIRGEVSEGMICAEDELGIGTSHDGIMVLREDAKVGMDAEDYLGFESDVIYEIGLTPNRSDATSHIGVAKDVQAYINFHQNKKEGISMPDVSSFAEGNEEGIHVEVLDVEACPRYTGILLSDLKVGPSPDWIKNLLESIGVRSINNVVDITNYVLHEYGQPLHAFDADKIRGNKIVVKQEPADTAFVTLDEVERKLHPEDLMICDAEGGMCIAGVFGGMGSGVTDATTRIFLESAHFNASSLRKTSFRHLLRTDAAMVFEKGSNPNITVEALKRAVLLLQEYAGAKVDSKMVDIYPNVIAPKEIKVSLNKLSILTGTSMDNQEIKRILEALNMPVVSENGDELVIQVPTDKADVTREVDILEEILRIYGFDNVPLKGYIHAAIPASEPVNVYKTKNSISDMLTGAGFSEMMAMSLVDNKHFSDEDASLVRINNTSNTNLNIMRPHMVFTALEAVAYNLNRQQNRLRLFENGRVYAQRGSEYQETSQMAMLMVGSKLPESWDAADKREVDFFDLKSNVALVLQKAGIDGFQTKDLENEYFEYGVCYHRGPKEVVHFGKVSTKLANQFGVKKPVYLAVFDWENILLFLSKKNISLEDITRFPSMRRDLALVVDKQIKMSQIEQIAKKVDKKLLKKINLFDVYENEDQLGANKKSYAISYHFENKEKTLKDKEVNKIMDKLIMRYEADLGALIRK